jgi:hypothetical protein
MNEIEPRLPSTRARGLPTKIKSAWACAWRPVPLPAPTVDPELIGMAFVPRSAEAIRYQVLRMEHALSPSGALRCWLKLNVLLALGLAIPAILLVPPATAIIAAFATWSAYLAAVALNLLLALVCAILIAAILSTVLGLARTRSAYRR